MPLDGKQGPWSDIYSAAAVLHHAIAGLPPPDAAARVGTDPYRPLATTHADRFEPAFLGAIDRALAFAPAERPQTVEEWAALFGPSIARVADAPTQRLGSASRRDAASRAASAATSIAGDAASPPPRRSRRRRMGLGRRPAGRRGRRCRGAALQAAAAGPDLRRTARGQPVATSRRRRHRRRSRRADTHADAHADADAAVTRPATRTCTRARRAQASLDRPGRARRAAGARRAGARRRSGPGRARDGGRGAHRRGAGGAAGPAERRAAHQ